MQLNQLSDMCAQIATLRLSEIYDCGFTCFRFENDEDSDDYSCISLLVDCGWQLAKRQRLFSLTEKDRPADFDQHVVSVLGPILGEPMMPLESPSLVEEPASTDYEPRSQPSRFEAAVIAHLSRQDLRVLSYELFGAGGLRVFFTKGYILTALPSNPDGDFHWAIVNDNLQTNLYCFGPTCSIAPW